MAEMILKPRAAVKPTPANIPAHISNGAARATLRAIERLFADPVVQKDYKKWLKEQEAAANG